MHNKQESGDGDAGGGRRIEHIEVDIEEGVSELRITACGDCSAGRGARPNR